MKTKMMMLWALLSVAACSKKDTDSSVQPPVTEGEAVYCKIDAARTTLGTAVDGAYPVVWQDGDAIRLFSADVPSGAVYATALDDNSQTAAFAPQAASVPGTMKRYAVYPAAAALSLDEGDVSVDFSGLRAQQIHTTLANNWPNIKLAPLYATAEAGEDYFVFGNLCGSVTLKLNDYTGTGDKIKKVKLTADKPVSGQGIIGGDGSITLVENGAASYSVTATAVSATGQSITASPATVNASKGVVFLLPATTYNSLRFEVTMMDGRVFEMSSNRSVSVEGGINKSYPTLQFTPYWGEANCLMMTPSSAATLDVAPYYTFTSDYSYENKRVKAEDGSNWLPTGLHIETLWELAAAASASASGSVLSACTLDGTTLRVTAGTAKGNALVALKDGDGNILWSFHIWVTDTPAELSYSAIGGGILQDRNLGATNTEKCNVSTNLDCIGLYYQWGRKDPFAISLAALPSSAKSGSYKMTSALVTQTTTDAANGNIAYGVAHPTERLIASATPYRWYVGAQGTNTGEEAAFWGSRVKRTWETADAAAEEPNGVKTVYDPCPAGYKVAEAKFMNFVKDVNAFFANPGYNIRYDGVNDNYWPPSGIFLHNAADVQYRGYRVYTWTASSNLNYSLRFFGYSAAISVQTSTNQGRASGCTVRCRKEDAKVNSESNLEEPEDE